MISRRTLQLMVGLATVIALGGFLTWRHYHSNPTSSNGGGAVAAVHETRTQEGTGRVASAAPRTGIAVGSQEPNSPRAAVSSLSSVESVVANIDQYKASAQTAIHFRPGKTALGKDAKDSLDEIANTVKGQRGYIIEVQGFSSGNGQAAIEDSQKMAESVVRYLVLNHEVPVHRIYLVGMGNAPPASAEEPNQAKPVGGTVSVTLLKNDLEQLGTATPASQAEQPHPR